MSSDFHSFSLVKCDKETGVKRDACLRAKEPGKAWSGTWRLDQTTERCASLPHIWSSLTTLCVCCVIVYAGACVCTFGVCMHVSVYINVCTQECVFWVCVHTSMWLTAVKGSMLTLRPSSAALDQSMLRERWKKSSHTAPSSSCFHLRPLLWPPLSTREG